MQNQWVEDERIPLPPPFRNKVGSAPAAVHGGKGSEQIGINSSTGLSSPVLPSMRLGPVDGYSVEGERPTDWLARG